VIVDDQPSDDRVWLDGEGGELGGRPGNERGGRNGVALARGKGQPTLGLHFVFDGLPEPGGMRRTVLLGVGGDRGRKVIM
jgi:hypothetical protein